MKNSFVLPVVYNEKFKMLMNNAGENKEIEPRGKTLNLIGEALQMDVKNLIKNEDYLISKTIGYKMVTAFFF